MRQSILKSCVSLAVLSIAGVSTAAFAQTAAPAAQADTAKPADTLGEIVVTASKTGKTKLNSSVSVSSVSNEQIANFNPFCRAFRCRAMAAPAVTPTSPFAV